MTPSSVESQLQWLIDEAIIQHDKGRHPYGDCIAPILDACLEWHLVLERIERDRERHWETANDAYDTL